MKIINKTITLQLCALVCFSECLRMHVCLQVLDEKQPQGLSGPLLHQYDNVGHPGVIGPGDALPSLQEDPHQGGVEAESRGFSQHLGPQLPLRDHLGSHLPGLWTSL